MEACAKALDRGEALAVLVTFQCGEALCAFQREQVVRLHAVPALSTPPAMPAALVGFANIAGGAVPVVDTGRLLGLGYAEDIDPIYRHLLLVLAGGAPLGLLVDRVCDVRDVDLDALTPAKSGELLNDCVLGDVSEGGKTIHVLDAERVLLAHEQARIADLRDAEQQRLLQWATSV